MFCSYDGKDSKKVTLLFYPKLTVLEMGKFTQKWYGKKMGKIGVAIIEGRLG